MTDVLDLPKIDIGWWRAAAGSETATPYEAATEQELGVAVSSGPGDIHEAVTAAPAAFGGVKGSGIGREFGPEALDAYVEYESIYLSARQM